MNSEKVWLICFANLHFIKLHFCTTSPKKRRPRFRMPFLSLYLLVCPADTVFPQQVAAVNWTEPDRSQCEMKGAFCSEETQNLARRFIDEAR